MNFGGCCFEIIEQKNNKVCKQEQVFFKKENEEGELAKITKEQFYKLEDEQKAAQTLEAETMAKEIDVAMNLNELKLDKR